METVRPRRVKFITLLVTRSCNLRCSYCYVRSYSGGDMDLETAKEIVGQAFQRAEGYDMIEFTFLGGEPFCAFPLVRELSEWVWAHPWPKDYCLTAVTNGTLIKGEIRDWLAANSHRFRLSLSYDGQGDSQNLNRCRSDSRIDLDFFHRHWPDVPVKMTITEASCVNMAGDIRSLKEKGVPVNDTFAGGMPPWSDKSLAVLDTQLAQLCDYELEHPNPHPSDLLSIDLRPVLFPQGQRPFLCGAGVLRETYDYDGRFYPCHLVSPLVLEDEKAAALRETGGTFQKPKACRQCFLDPICPQCDGNSFRLYGCFGRREEGMCRLFKHQLLFACRFQAKRILRKPQIGQDDRLILEAIGKIMSLLSE